MRTRYNIVENDQIYFITSTIIEWLPVFTRKPYFDILIKALNFTRSQKGFKLYAYVIMDNHLHLIGEGNDLGKIIKEFKSHTAREIIKLAEQENKGWLLNQLSFYKPKHKVGSTHQVWQEGYHPQQISSEEMLRQRMEYLHYNPVRGGAGGEAGGLALFQRPELCRVAGGVGDRPSGDLEIGPSRAWVPGAFPSRSLGTRGNRIIMVREAHPTC